MNKRFGLIGITPQQYTEKVKPMAYDVTFQDEGGTAVIDIEGYIGRDLMREWITGEKSKNTAENLKEEIRSFEANKIIVNIHSPGGDLSEGLVIKNMLQAKRAKVVTNLQGFSASAATVIQQAGDTRRMPEHSSFMLIHRAMLGVMGFLNQNTTQSMTEDLEVIDNQMIEMYLKRTQAIRGGAGKDDIIDLMDDGEGYGKWIDASTALEMGFIDEVYDPGDEEDEDIDRLENMKAAARNASKIWVNGEDMLDAMGIKENGKTNGTDIEFTLGSPEEPKKEESKKQESKNEGSAAAAEARSREVETIKIKGK